MSSTSSLFFWISLASGLFILSFGAGCGILIACHIVAFLVGVLTTYLYYGKQTSDATYGFSHSMLRPASTGIESVSGPPSAKQLENLDKRLTGASVIDDVLHEIMEYIFRDYIHSWHMGISSDTHFPVELRETLRAAIVAFATQAKSTSWVPYITGGLVDEVASHIKLYRQAEEAVKKESKSYAGAMPDAKFNEKLESKFFDLETDMENNLCRDLICTQKNDRKHYLQNLSEALLFLLLPQSSFDCRILRYLAREILVNAVFDPTVDLLTDPDYVNQCIIWTAEDSAFNRESFLSAVKISDSVEELTAVLEKIEHESALHRSHDKGGANDSNIKQVLGSLNYVKKLTAARLQLFASRAGDDEVDASELSLTGMGTIDLSSALSLQALLTNAIGVQYFNDYLITHDFEMYLNFLLDIECCMKVAGEQSQLITGGSVTIAEDRELSEMCQDIYSKYTSLEVINKMNLDNTLITNYKEMMHSAKPSTEVFESLHEQVFERLEIIYEDFKKDHRYRRLLRELKLSSDALALEAAATSADDADSVGSSDTVKEKEKPFTLYVVEVTQTFGDGRHSQRWQTKRRYREFDEFRSLLSGKYADLSAIPFPGKKPFNNMSKEFLDKRTSALNTFLLALFKAEKQGAYAGLLEDLLHFLQAGAWSKERHAQRLTSKSESGRFYLSASIKPPAGGTKLSADVIFGDFLQGVGRVFKVGSVGPGSTSREPSTYVSSSKNRVGASLDLSGNDDESIPLRIILLLFDEVFDLRRKNQWFRRRVVAILRQIVKTTLGDSINRRIVEHVDDMLSADRIAEYLRMLRDALWPGGFQTETKPPRDAACMQRTRVVCKAKMLDTIADEVRHFIGSDATNRGVLLVFSMFQHQALNRRLLFVIAEGVFRTLFPNNNFERVFREMHSRSKRVTRQSTTSSGSSLVGTYSTGLE